MNVEIDIGTARKTVIKFLNLKAPKKPIFNPQKYFLKNYVKNTYISASKKQETRK